MSLLIRVFVATVLAASGLTLVLAPSATASTLQSGVVTTGDGTPLAGATVAVFDESGKGIAGATTTGQDGRYTLEDCPSCVGQIVASAEGYSSSRSGPDYTLFALAKPYVGWASTTILTFGWDAVPGAVAYRITFASERTFKNPTIISPATKTVHTFKQLLKNHIYYLRVYPIDSDSHVIKPDIWLGDDNRPVAGRTGYVNNLRATNRTTTSIALQWAPLLFAKGTEYEVQLSKSPTFAAYRTKWSLHGDNTLTFGNLNPGTIYYARARARNVSHTYTTPWSGTKVVSTS